MDSLSTRRRYEEPSVGAQEVAAVAAVVGPGVEVAVMAVGEGTQEVAELGEVVVDSVVEAEDPEAGEVGHLQFISFRRESIPVFLK